jgi:dimethylargininase
MEMLAVDPSEPHGANALRIGDGVIYSSAHPRTREKLEKRGIRVTAVEMSEMEKAEGAVTCCSLVFQDNHISF